MAVEWYYEDFGSVTGPVDSRELKALAERGKIFRQTRVKRRSGENLSEWVEAGSIKSLFADAEPMASRPPTPLRQLGVTFLTSSSLLVEQYETLGVVYGFASQQEGCGAGISVEKSYKQALDRCIEAAKSRGANALIGVDFQNRVATAPGCGGAKQAFEVFAWGTAVKYYV